MPLYSFVLPEFLLLWKTQLEERRPECLLMSSTKVQNSYARRAAAEDILRNFTSLNLRKPQTNQLILTLERRLLQTNVKTSGRYFSMTSRS
jgi:hypothetical protein